VSRFHWLSLLLAWSLGATAATVGPRVGLAVEGLSDPARQALLEQHTEVESRQLLDYTFGSAPTDWLPSGGAWQVFSRFACDPSWSFYGGHSPAVACLWHKRRFEGPIVVEAYVAFKHGLPYNEDRGQGRKGWSYRPADLCLTLCGDGASLDSGYSFVYGADEGTRTLVRRGAQVLAATEDPELVTPSFCDAVPDSEEFHRRWWRLEAHVADGRLTFFIDGHKAIEAVDPRPLTGGKIALWTVRNGMMIARVRVAYTREVRPAEPAVRVLAAEPWPGRDGAG